MVLQFVPKMNGGNESECSLVLRMEGRCVCLVVLGMGKFWEQCSGGSQMEPGTKLEENDQREIGSLPVLLRVH